MFELEKETGARQAFHFFPQTWATVVLIASGFSMCIMFNSTPFGLGHGSRFHTWAHSCYHDETWYKLSETDPYCPLFSYPFRLVQPTALRILPWLLYLAHQFGQWFIIRQAQLAKERGEIGWAPPDSDAARGEVEAQSKSVPAQPNIWAKRMFALNFGMVVFKFVQSNIYYDGLSNDVPEFSALYSVVLWVILALIIQMPSRGLIFGFIRSFPKVGGSDLVWFVRKYHGHAFSFGVTYNFWYHPIEGSPGFILGYLYQFLMLLQSSFLFHPFHRNKIWTLILEMGLIPHAIFIIVFQANGMNTLILQICFGFILLFVTTFMHNFDFTILQKCGFAAIIVALTLWTHWLLDVPITPVQLVQVFPVQWAAPIVVWILWLIGSLLLTPFKSLNEAHPWTTGAFWFGIWAAQLAFFLWWGAWVY